METRREQDMSLSSGSTHRSSEAGEGTRANITTSVESIVRQVGLDKVYGDPIVRGETIIVPVAEVRTGFGYGQGHDADQEEGGSGGGAGVRLTPRGFIEMTDEGVQYRPVFSYTPFVAGGAFLAWLLYRFVSR